MKIANNITELIGNTPLVRINKLAKDSYANIYAKLELFNPLSSVKDRIALAMIEDAEKNGLINEDTIIIEPTSGNTGIGLAYVCAVKGYKLILIMPDTMSIERRKLLKIFGAEIILTPGTEGMKGAINEAERVLKKAKNSFMPQQFINTANPEMHRRTTALEIWDDTEGKVDIIISGVGTGGTITGVAEVLKKKNSKIISIAVEPEDSPVLSGGKPSSHKIQGIGAGFVPDILNTEIIDEIIQVNNEEAFQYAKKMALEEGIFVGISSGAAMYAAIEVSKREENKEKNTVVILPDTGERYLSLKFWEEN